MLDNETFIRCVEKHPDIWDRKSKYYKDRNVREKRWNHIGNQMFPQWQILTEEQKQDKIMFMKSKWHNLRDALMRCIRQNRQGKRRRYLYEDKLSFLLKKSSPKGRASKQDSDDEDTRDESDDELDQLDALITPKNEVEDEIEIDETDLLDMLPKTKPYENRLALEHSQFSSDQSDLKEEEDGDKSFLMSLLPDVRKLNDRQRLDFRFHCLQFFRDLQQRKEMENGSEATNIPTS